jgi:all-trans-8'-apo-beta-carotenal 15,15'-oxygenase
MESNGFAGDSTMVTSPPAELLSQELDAKADFAPGLENAFAHPPSESAYFIDDIEGRVPVYISGSYYLNGPAAFSRAGVRYRHWLDGDGMVCRLRFSEGSIHFANRFVRTTKFNMEQKAERPIFRTFGTTFPGDILKRGIALESPGNVSVYPFHGTLLAFGEQALPWELNPDTLETIGPFDFGGMLTELSPVAAHPKLDQETGEVFNFGTFYSRGHSKLCLYSFDETGKLRRRTNHQMEHPFSIHDFGLSRAHLAFYLSPYLLDVDAMVRGNQSLMDSLQWQPELGSRLQIFSRNSGEQVASVPLPGRYCLHLINCFEEQQRLVVDVIELEKPVYDQYQPLPYLFTNVPSGRPVRLVLDLDTQRLVSRHELGYRLAPDFPAIDPVTAARPYTEFWMLGLSKAGQMGRKFFDELVHARWDEPEPADVFRTHPGSYLCGEPVFVRNPKSAEGVVICQHFDAEREQSSFLVFNSRDVRSGPVATLRLKELIHLGFHATFRAA